MKQDVEQIARGLTKVQRQRLATVNPSDVDRFHYHPFKGASHGLFQVAAGWKAMELSPLGLAVKAHLQEQGS